MSKVRPHLCMLYPGIRLTKKQGKNLSQGSRKVPFGHDSVYRHGQLLTGLSTLASFGRPGPTVGQRSMLAEC